MNGLVGLFILLDFTSMLNLFMTLGSGSSPDPNIYYRTTNYCEYSKICYNGEKAEKGGAGVQTIGKIDIKKYQVVTKEIRSSDVVISDERIKHIKERHPSDFEKYSHYIERMLLHPQYILADPVPNTAVILHEFSENDERFRLILRLAVVSDEEYKSNSIITFLKISEKKFKKYLRNKIILYKSE